MYNKISSIILNSGKSSGFSDVFVAQPDSLKEGLAGKFFVIAEIGAKKNEAKKMFDFLISSLETYYYDDEKILLRDKIEGLKVENIFEAAVAKTNKSISEFLVSEKIKLNSTMTNISIGVIYENKLYFATFGRNRAFLVYKHGGQYEIINVEANASEQGPSRRQTTESLAVPVASSFFSSVISGEIPVESYFVFTSEALPEYISNKDLINIVTKLPPVVAAEQIKNNLSKINTFIPFLGIIIKNTIGLDRQEVYEEVEENLNAHSSISSLKNTEDKTERMLEPAGLINFSKLYKSFLRTVNKRKQKSTPLASKIYKNPEDDKNNYEFIAKEDPLIIKSKAEPETPVVMQDISVGKISSLKLAQANSFVVKEKMFFKKRPNLFNFKLKNVFTNVGKIFNIHYLRAGLASLKVRFTNLEIRNRRLLFGLAGTVIILIGSILITNWSKKQEALRNNYNNLIAAIEERKVKIETSLLYENQEGAQLSLKEARDLLNYLPRDKKDQEAMFNELVSSLNEQADKIQKLVKIDNPEKVNDLSGLGVNNLTWANDKMYAASANKVYEITPQSSESKINEIATATNLDKPYFDGRETIYYFDAKQLFKFNTKNSQVSPVNIGENLQSEAINYKIYSNNLYILTNQGINKSSLSGGAYQNKSAWLKNQIDLTDATDLYIPSTSGDAQANGRIFVLKNDGQVLKLMVGQAEDYKSAVIEPALTQADKLLIGNQYIYIFDTSAKRLVVLALNDGHLVKQYQTNSLTELRDVAIDENNRAAYFLNGEIVYKINLQN